MKRIQYHRYGGPEVLRLEHASLDVLALDTADALSSKAARALLRPGGRIIDIVPGPRKFARTALPGPYRVMIAQPVTTDLEEAARLAARGELRIPIARTVPLTDAIPALTELERDHTPRGGKLIVDFRP